MIAKMKARGIRCSFCGGSGASIVAGTPQRANGVPKAMIGKSAFICNECVERYHAMITHPENPNNPFTVPK